MLLGIDHAVKQHFKNKEGKKEIAIGCIADSIGTWPWLATADGAVRS
jgi:hypothetical protein